jgi:hypothetical protein
VEEGSYFITTYLGYSDSDTEGTTEEDLGSEDSGDEGGDQR